MQSIWDWVEAYREEALARGDEQRVQMTEIHPVAYSFRETSPEQALALFEEGRRLAQSLQEPAWVLFFDHWRATTWLHFQRDYSRVLDLTVRTALEARKPAYDQHPLRYAAFDDLLAAYLGIDTAGYAELIQQSLDYLEGVVPDEPCTSRYLLLARRRLFAMEMGQLAEAHRQIQLELALADTDSDRHRGRHFSVFAHTSGCEVAYRRRDWEALAHHASSGESMARIVGHQLELSELLAWQAVNTRLDGQEQAAQRLFRTATSRLSRLRMPPSENGFTALCAFHEEESELPEMLAIRRAELASLSDKGRLAYEARCCLHVCAIHARLGEPMDEEVESARLAITRLRKPDPYLKRLSQITGQSGS